MFYDLFPLIGLWFAAAVAWGFAHGWHYDGGHPDYALHAGVAAHLLLQAWLFAVAYAYFAISWARVGATIGMRAWKLKLVREDGARVDMRTAALRFVLALLSLALLGCGFWYAWFDPDRRTWHDRVCGTRMTRL
jgi:uncharacterized RDD family membrane protein YckC